MCNNCDVIFAQGQSMYIHGPQSIIEQFHAKIGAQVNTAYTNVLSCDTLNTLPSKTK